jgi:Ser/Thr protein kinase RdoA (MazF antagonist)
MTDNCRLPEFQIDEAAALARRLYGLEGPIRQLDGERDLNFLVGEAGARFVFKIANADESPAMLECQHRVFERLAAAAVFPLTATARESVNGRQIETVCSADGTQHACRVLPYLEGHLFREFEDPSPALLADIGCRLARVDLALESFRHPALERPLWWKMDNALTVLETFKPALADEPRLQLVEFFERGYRKRVLPRIPELRRAVIHNDANRANLLVDEAGTRLLSIIDFGDMVESYLVVEAAVAATYAMLDRPMPLDAAASLIGGYHAELPLRQVEAELVFDFICMRLCTSVCIGAHQCALQPGNDYLASDLAPAWELLQVLRDIDPAAARAAIF